MSAHTQGPWKWFNYPDGRKLLSATTRAVIHCPDAPMTCEPDDAALIAAAPVLLDACRQALEACRDNLSKYAYKNEPVLLEAFKACAAAIEQVESR